MRDLTVDLIVSTLGTKPLELRRLAESLERQTYRSFRLIVVDQSADGQAVRAVDGIDIPTVALRSEIGGARGRNTGLAAADADLAAFPDDDCWYPNDLLERVVALAGEHSEWAGVCGRSLDASGRPSNMRWDSHPGRVGPLNCWKRAITYTMFLRRQAVEHAGGFNESFGMPWTAGGETDLLLRIIEGGGEVHYEPALTVHHPQQRPDWSRESSERGYRYGLGAGSVMRRHGQPIWFAAWRVGQLTAAAVGLLVAGRASEARFYGAMARGRVRGWFAPRTGWPSGR